MTSIRVQERTSIDDVLAWRVAECDTISVSRRGSFEPGAQGLALAALTAVRPGREAPWLDCDFEEPSTLDDLESTFFGSAVGFALPRLISGIQFQKAPASSGFKRLLGDLYKARRGILGSGRSKAIVCADPVFPFAPCLMSQGSPADPLPTPSAFSILLNSEVEKMGFRRLLGSTAESSVVSFVYESFRNSWEHGISLDPHRGARSTRALIIEKIVLQAADLASRQISPELKDYLTRIVAANQGELGLGVICLSVADQGDGIQATLPISPDHPGETDTERLARAFIPGESRKAAGVVQRGLGLPNIIAAAHSLQALLRVTSGDLVASQDFSYDDEKYPQLKLDSIRRLPDGAPRGTCVSLFVPEFALSPDQRSLFAS
ncbi:hypothetical protein RSP673_016940 (plasmid) [Ralstonia solanacearum P673]|uniref:hypothetical protein n=1 Tax=Ralstonia solanacearum TaxID=305 RepID=UPI0009B8D958|nr:hypothetical protein [Ralstonia solanacearum]MCL9851522.1 hypothetical protein [Ralstonia solanacearum]MCL9854409.1 hypothetical protein [Ralstonia solanacearum]MCL9859408.1 hypothetical protein [Ralstonia solanacearum]MCL9866336.1 hypothetical protein [Ralstonia solanacearum]MCL9871048.1 hypothetical protein [Ralstonia solanacearum]